METYRAPPSVEVLRAKLVAAIVAEAWEAVRVINERLREVKRAASGKVVALDAAKRRGDG